MKTNTPAPLRKYLRQLRSWLPCPGSMKRMILSDVQDNAAELFQENPQANYGDLVARFGSPDRLAASYIQDMDTRKLLRELRIKRRVSTAVIVALITALLIWSGAAIASIVDAYNHNRGYTIIFPAVEYQEGTE